MILSAQWQLGNAGRNCRTNNFLDFSCSHWPLDSWPSKPASLLARDQILPVTGDVDRFIRGGRKTALPCNVLYVHTTTISVSVPNRRAAVLTFIRIFSEVIKSLNLGDPSNILTDHYSLPTSRAKGGRRLKLHPSIWLFFLWVKNQWHGEQKKIHTTYVFENFI